jgi:hypothetical protein
MILKDLIIEDKELFVEIAAFVIIKRTGKYYEIAVRMRHDYDPRTDQGMRLINYKNLIKRFMEECRRVNMYYIISEGNVIDTHSVKIHEEEIIF